jgi:hypothetical protein
LLNLQSHKLLSDGLNPYLEKRQLASLGTDSDGVDITLAQIGLVEHVPESRIGQQSE